MKYSTNEAMNNLFQVAVNDAVLPTIENNKVWMLTGTTKCGGVFYCKTWDHEPSRKTVRMLKDRYDNKYGAYLTWSLKEV